MILLKNRYSKHIYLIENLTGFGDMNLLESVVIAEKLNLGKIAKFKKLKNTKFFKIIFFFGFSTITTDPSNFLCDNTYAPSLSSFGKTKTNN